MYYAYARDPDMKLNLGIRRRLAPLMDNDRRRIELLNCLLLTLPGSPIIYYGDEIGMGDNVHLGDRDGVRTPMQWSRERNAGFSTAADERLYLPVITDAVYGYQGLNVTAQARTSASFLNTMRRLIAARRTSSAFGRGSIDFLRPRNQRVLAYLRRYRREVLLIVANLAGSSQPVELDLAEFAGATPVEVLGQARFPPVQEHPYFLGLGPHGFYWFRLERPQAGDEPYGLEASAI
jgi:maltose alpha-D-glucosyltransferase/alpha-amylase